MTIQNDNEEIFLEVLQQLGFETYTPIQALAIPVLAKGQSLFALAPTGSGKTLAFLMPLILNMSTQKQETQLLILVPTRELGTQIAQVAEKVSRCLSSSQERPFTIRTAFGGQKIENQQIEIERQPHLIIATPGRAFDLIDRESLRLDTLRAIVLDEADQMLSMGFEQQMSRICERLPRHVQTALFSATETDLQTDLHERLTRVSVRVDVRDDETARSAEVPESVKNGSVHQYILASTHHAKSELLVEFLRSNHGPIENGIIFCQTRLGASELCESLRKHGFAAEELSGSRGQIERSSIMRRFKSRGIKFLVATNIAARGIDIDALSIVINYDLPSTPTEYLHRSGRSGRAGKTGRTLSFCLTGAEPFFKDIMLKNGIIPELVNPNKSATPVPAIADANEPTPPAPLMRFEKIHLNRGKSSKLRAGDILGALTKEAGLLAQDVGSIFIFDHFSHIEVNAEKVRWIIKKLSTIKIKNLIVRASEARELTNAKPGAR